MAAAVILLGAATAEAGTLYRCTDAAGKSEFRSTPCPSDSRAVSASNSAAVDRPVDPRLLGAQDEAQREARDHASARAASAPRIPDGSEFLTIQLDAVTLAQAVAFVGEFSHRATTIDAGVDRQAVASIHFKNLQAAEAQARIASLYGVRIVSDDRVMRVMKLR